MSSSSVERARSIADKVRQRNQRTWDEVDREVVFAIDALVAHAEWLYMRNKQVAAAERKRLHDKFMEIHNSQQHSNNYWHFAARKIMEES
jgi:hypothetical protein